MQSAMPRVIMFICNGTGNGTGKLHLRLIFTYLCGQFLGVLSVLPAMAEKIPAEPDQGNACAGKVISSFCYFSPFFRDVTLVIIQTRRIMKKILALFSLLAAVATVHAQQSTQPGGRKDSLKLFLQPVE